MEQKLYPSAPYSSSDKDVESMKNKHLPKVSSFNNSIQIIVMMMKYYEMEEKKYTKNTPNTS